jgi:uncharacterized membrane protein YccC
MNILLKIDPSFVYLKNASRGTVAVILSFLICSKFIPLMGFLGGMIALLCNLLVSDNHIRDQKITTRFIAPLSFMALASSILLSTHRPIQLIFFAVATFIAIYLRKFGLRWLSLGMVIFMSYFLPLFFPFKAQDMAYVFLSVIIATSISYIIRFIILPDRPEIILKNLLKAWNKCYQARDLSELTSLTLLIESKNSSESLQHTMFEREMDLQFHGIVSEEPLKLDAYTESKIIREEELKEASGSEVKAIESTTKLAIQSLIAVVIAAYLGHLVSTQRWYWAPLAAFVTLAGTSRGETLVRSFLRVLGTVIGLGIGVLIAPYVKSYPDIEWGFIILSIFGGMFAMRFTFGFWTATTFTFMITMLFSVLGQFTEQVLILRLEETLLGALIGTIVSYFVLPTSTTEVIKASIEKIFMKQAKVLSLLPLDLSLNNAKKNLVRAIRDLDQETSQLKILAAPYTENYSLIKRKKITKLLHHTAYATHYVKYLATLKKDLLPLEKAELKRIESYLRHLSSNMDPLLNDDAALNELGKIRI